MRKMLETITFVILPCVNPDGYEFTRSSTNPHVRFIHCPLDDLIGNEDSNLVSDSSVAQESIRDDLSKWSLGKKKVWFFSDWISVYNYWLLARSFSFTELLNLISITLWFSKTREILDSFRCCRGVDLNRNFDFHFKGQWILSFSHLVDIYLHCRVWIIRWSVLGDIPGKDCIQWAWDQVNFSSSFWSLIYLYLAYSMIAGPFVTRCSLVDTEIEWTGKCICSHL